MQAWFLKANASIPKDVTIAYLSCLNWDLITFDQNLQIIRTKDYNMIFRKYYKASERIKLEWVSGLKEM